MTLKSLYRSLGVLLIIGSAAISAQAAEATCDASSLKGDYEFSAWGKTIPMSGIPGKASVYIYDLRNVTVTGTISFPPSEKDKVTIQATTITDGFPTITESTDGTYTVGAVGTACKGKMKFTSYWEIDEGAKEIPFNWSYDFELEKDGKIRFVSATGNNKLIAGQAQPIVPAAPVTPTGK